MADVQILPSSRSLESDPHTTRFGASATLVYPGEDYSDYGFIAVLGLAQRLKIDLLPITWQVPLGPLGRGGQGEINQALVYLQTSFAFKLFDHAKSDPFSETVQEIIGLSHPLVQDHPHIVKLIGICWDIPRDDQVWPVLVFEKTQLGDLYHFARFGKGKDLSLEDKLKICADVGIAIRDMHLNNIIHGDIKPQNVLMFEDRPGIYTAKVADFGFSTYFHGEQDLIKIPESVPWNAPEHHNRYFYPKDAKAMDVYSFGMLCLWLLFSVESSKTIPYSSGVANGARAFSFEAQDWSQKGDLLLSWKRDRLLKWAIWLVAKYGHFGTEIEDSLTQFFQSSLCFSHRSRNIDWKYLLNLLAPTRKLPRTEIFNEEMLHKKEDFQITSSLWSLYQADFRLRPFMVTQLETITSASTKLVFKHISTAKAAEQLALCYQIGFGVPRRERKEREALTNGSQSNAIEDQIRLIKDSEPHLFEEGGISNQLYIDGFFSFIDDSQYYREKRLINRAMKAYRREIQDIEEVFGKDHWLSHMQKSGFAVFLKDQGQWKEAEQLEVQVMEASMKELGERHPSTLNSIANLASTYWNQGRWKEAEQLETQVVEASIKELGERHPDTLNRMGSLALTYSCQGRWKEAEQLQAQVMEASIKGLGERHPSTLHSIANLASIYRRQGRWKEAKQLQVQVMEASIKELGKRHPSTLNSVTSLALTYSKQGRWKEAEQLEAQVMEASIKELGERHPSTLNSIANLASTYWNQGQWKEAEQLDVQVMEASIKELGERHPDALNSMESLASTYRNQGRWKEAEQLEVQVMEASIKELGERHPDTLTCIANLASTYSCQGRWKEAEQLEVQVMEASIKELGERHPDTLNCIANLASTYSYQGRWKEAEQLEVQVMEASIKELGERHPDTLACIANLASTYNNQGRWKEAEQLEVQVMEASIKELGERHPNTLISMANLAWTYRNQGQWREAEQLQAQVMEARKKELGERHPSTLISMASLAFIWKSQGRKNNALLLMKECSRLQQQVLGSKHPDTMASFVALDQWQMEKKSGLKIKRRFKPSRVVFQRVKGCRMV